MTITANDPEEPIEGGVVQFTPNPAANGATAIFVDAVAVIVAGRATVLAAPNNVLGSYTVTADSPGSSTSIALTNAGKAFAFLVVITTSDSLAPGTGLLSLREALGFANTAPGGSQTITFDPALFATGGTITLTASQFELSQAVAITGQRRASRSMAAG